MTILTSLILILASCLEYGLFYLPCCRWTKPRAAILAWPPCCRPAWARGRRSTAGGTTPPSPTSLRSCCPEEPRGGRSRSPLPRLYRGRRSYSRYIPTVTLIGRPLAWGLSYDPELIQEAEDDDYNAFENLIERRMRRDSCNMHSSMEDMVNKSIRNSSESSSEDEVSQQ